MQTIEAPESMKWLEGKMVLTNEQYRELVTEASVGESLKVFLNESKNIEDVMFVFKVFGVKPHIDLLWEIEQKNINVSPSLLKEWEEKDA